MKHFNPIEYLSITYLCVILYAKFSFGKSFFDRSGKNLNVSVVNENYHDIQVNVEASTQSVLDEDDPINGNISISGLVPGNDLTIGVCNPGDQRIYTDNTIIENNGLSTLNGTMEIHIDSPIIITCVVVKDQITDGTGATPSFNSGGVGHNWVHINVEGKYGKGYHFLIHVYGVPDLRRHNPIPT